MVFLIFAFLSKIFKRRRSESLIEGALSEGWKVGRSEGLKVFKTKCCSKQDLYLYGNHIVSVLVLRFKVKCFNVLMF